MKNTKSILALLILALPLASGCKQKASDEIDFGTVKNSVYKNKYFGLTLPLPEKWNVQDQETRAMLQETGVQLISGDDKNMKAIIKASELSTVNLLMVSKHPLGAPVPFNPNIACIAERVKQLPGIKQGKDYLFHSKKTLQSSQLEVSYPIEMTSQTLGGQAFDVMHVETSITGMTVRQEYFSMITKGYALSFITSFTTDEDKAELLNILKSISFE